MGNYDTGAVLSRRNKGFSAYPDIRDISNSAELFSPAPRASQARKSINFHTNWDFYKRINPLRYYLRDVIPRGTI